jgi:hypothetical protein
VNAHEIPYDRQLQSQTLHTIFAALGGLNYDFGGPGGITIDDIASVRQTRHRIDADGKKYLYTTNVTVSVSRVELPK